MIQWILASLFLLTAPVTPTTMDWRVKPGAPEGAEALLEMQPELRREAMSRIYNELAAIEQRLAELERLKPDGWRRERGQLLRDQRRLAAERDLAVAEPARTLHRPRAGAPSDPAQGELYVFGDSALVTEWIDQSRCLITWETPIHIPGARASAVSPRQTNFGIVDGLARFGVRKGQLVGAERMLLCVGRAEHHGLSFPLFRVVTLDDFEYVTAELQPAEEVRDGNMDHQKSGDGNGQRDDAAPDGDR